MKKVLVLCLVLVMALSAGVASFAAPNNFLDSPGRKPAPSLEDYENENHNCTAKLVITPYVERDTLAADTRKNLEDAYNQIVNAKDLTTFSDDLANLAEELRLTPDKLAVSELFDISYLTDCPDHANHGRFKITLASESLKNYVGIMHRDGNGKWTLLESELLNNSTKVRFYTLQHLSPFAIIVSTEKIPDTSDNSTGALWTLLISATALAVVVVVSIKLRKNEA